VLTAAMWKTMRHARRNLRIAVPQGAVRQGPRGLDSRIHRRVGPLRNAGKAQTGDRTGLGIDEAVQQILLRLEHEGCLG
jgi:hypothetical protein